MTTCANCQGEALYTYAVNESYLIHYCQLHLPRFLTAQKQSGQLPLRTVAEVVEPIAPAVEEAPAAPVEPEVVTATEPEPSATVEEAPAAEPVVEATEPTKTTTSKK